MKTISSSEFTAHPERYLDMASHQEVRIKKGRKTYHLTCEASDDEQLVLQPDDDFHRAITAEELKKRMHVSIHKFFEDK